MFGRRHPLFVLFLRFSVGVHSNAEGFSLALALLHAYGKSSIT